MRSEIYELFDEFDTDTINVSDFEIVVNGTLIENIHLGHRGKIQIWAGNPDTDKDAEELLLTKYQRRKVFEEIIENM